MSTQIQRRRGTTAQHASFTGAVGETTIDTDKEVVVVHDGVQVGGYPQMRENGSNSALALGSAGTPSLKFTGDTNTGIYSPGADQLAISTNGLGRLYVDSSGRVGVGGTPSSLLHVQGSASNLFRATTTDAGASNILSINNNDNFNYGIIGVTSGNGTAGGDVFGAGYTSVLTSDFTPVINWTSQGRVGIGTSSPDTNSRLHVSASENTSDPFATDASVAISNYQAAGNNEAASLKFLLGAAPGTNAGSISCHYDSFSAGVNSSLRFYTVYQSGFNSPAERMRIDPQGRVGIGSTSPQNLFVISNGGANGLEFNPTTESGTANYVISYNRTAAAYRDLRFDAAATRFEIGGNEAARIDSSRRLLVGTSSNVNGTIGNSVGWPAMGQFSSTSTQNIPLGLFHWSTYAVDLGGAGGGLGNGPDITLSRSNSNNKGEHALVTNNMLLGRINFGGSDGTQFLNGACIAAAVDSTPGTNDMPGRLVFSTTADGASSPTERFRIDNAGAVLIGTTSYHSGVSSNTKLQLTSPGGDWLASFINSASAVANCFGLRIVYNSATPNSAGNTFLLCGDATADRFAARSNGGLANYQANNVNLSDRNAKKDISPASDTWDCIKEWEIVNYRYKDQPDDADLNLGVIAQQVAESCPEVITVFQEAKEATEDQPAQEERLGIKEQQMYWMAIKALQEAQVRIEALEAEVAALKAQ